MLSGGMDSGSIVAVAREILAEEGRGPLPTFSAVGPDPEICVETRTIHAALTMDGLASHLIRYDRLDALMPDLEALTWSLDEPFDYSMTLPRAVYLSAHRTGLKVLLDGGGGDLALDAGSYIARLIRRGRWWRAYCEAVGQIRFWGKVYPAWREMYRAARSALAIPPVRGLHRRLLGSRRLRQQVWHNIRESLIHPDFAARLRLAERLKTLNAHGLGGGSVSYREELARSIDHPYLTVGRERYDRVASAVAVEPRDPFLDRRVVAFCVSLPGEQKLDGGWPKIVLRRAMAGRLPDLVRWRTGKEHLGWTFTSTLIAMTNRGVPPRAKINRASLAPYLNDETLFDGRTNLENAEPTERQRFYELEHLGAWLDRHRGRPQGTGSVSIRRALLSCQLVNLSTRRTFMKNQLEDQKHHTQPSTARIYRTPHLVGYGAIRQLTQGGGSNTGENLKANPGSDAYMRKL
jgi:asparagine synthase (glutamine-hydrolysing)